MNWFLDRAKEKSTWIGLAALLGMFGFQVDDQTMNLISQFVVTGAGLAAVLMKEKSL